MIVVTNGLVPLESIINRIQVLEKIKREIEAELQKTEDKITGIQVDKKEIKEAFTVLKKKIKTDKNNQVKQLVSLLVKEIRVGNEGIEIDYNLNALFDLSLKTTYVFTKSYRRKVGSHVA